ncbi:MAG: VWA domain-containing protein [Pyrinomonadaceae bacterium]|nr:VWA domain-containing protein [Pyrinomonadaceae bacterium]
MPSKTRNTGLLTQDPVSLPSLHRFLVLFYCSLLAIAASLPVKASGQDTSENDDVIKVSTDLLLFPIRIRDKRGQIVRGLEQSDLTLKDKDQVTTGLYFAPGTDRVAIVFALDQSGSLREIISQQQDAAIALFGRFSDRSSVAVLRFAESSSLVVPFGRDPAATRAAFSFNVGTNQRTAIFDAAAKALRVFDDLPRVRTERRIVVLISDGLDNASQTKAKAVIDAALEKRVSFYVVHLPLFEPREGRLAVRSPARGFRELARETGGNYFLVGGESGDALKLDKTVDLAPIFQAIEEDLKSQYLLGFYINETARDGRKHRFSLKLLPSGVEYSVGRLGYSRSHDFFVNLPSGVTKLPK